MLGVRTCAAVKMATTTFFCFPFFQVDRLSDFYKAGEVRHNSLGKTISDPDLSLTVLTRGIPYLEFKYWLGFYIND